MKITSAFDGGNIVCLSSDDPQDIRLEIRKDNNSDFLQWFCFRLTGARGEDCCLKITNAGQCSYTEGWKGYRVAASYDREHWFRVPTEFDGACLTFTHRPEFGSIYFAYFAPYSIERHADLIADAQSSPMVEMSCLGSTLDGQDLDLLHIASDGGDGGDGDATKRICWVIARQHPGETMAEWWMEGFLSRLLDEDDPVARELLDQAVFYVVPNMNPDGSRRGNLRTNAAGANLNREWQDPSLERSPEVFLVRQKMEETGVDFSLDVHGDEGLPYNFIAGSEGIPGWSDRLAGLLTAYTEALVRASPDFQVAQGYPVAAPGKGNLTMCTSYLAEAFDCLAMTLEMPFKDTADRPNQETGWSPERSRKLGAANLDALLAVIGDLRAGS